MWREPERAGEKEAEEGKGEKGGDKKELRHYREGESLGGGCNFKHERSLPPS